MTQEKSPYKRAVAVDSDDALRMAMETKETEEKRFYTFIADMTLQRWEAFSFPALVRLTGLPSVLFHFCNLLRY